jgi:hypothetical protein
MEKEEKSIYEVIKMFNNLSKNGEIPFQSWHLYMALKDKRWFIHNNSAKSLEDFRNRAIPFSTAEIARATGISAKSKTHIQKLLNAMQDAGLIEFYNLVVDKNKKSRRIRILVNCTDDWRENKEKQS